MGKWEMVRLGDVADKLSSNIAQKDLETNDGQYPIYGASGLIKFVDFYRHENEYIAVVKDGAGIGRTMMLPAKSSVIGTMQSLIPRKTINAKYLYYAVSSMNLARYYTGATIPHIYFKDYKGELLPLPPFPIQQKIAAVLDKASALIEKRKAQIEKLDLLVKAQFIEMFGDPVTNPKGWEVKKLEECLVKIENGMSPNCETFPALSDREGVLKLSAVTYGYYQSQENKQLLPDTTFNSQIEVKDNDLLMTRKNTYDLVGMSAYVFSTRSGLMLPDLIFRLVPKKIINRIYLWQLINCGYFRDNIKRLASGTSGSMPNISKERLRSLCIPIPSSNLQNHFADFVQQVEAQKAILQQSLVTLELNYKSLMQKCFRGEVYNDD